MEYKELYYTLQDIFPNYAEEILRGLFLLNDGLEKTKESIGNIPYKILKENNNLDKITDMENKIDDLLKSISALGIDITAYQDSSDKRDDVKSKSIDSSIPDQPIDENLFQKMDFTGTKPIKFKLLGEEREITSWKDLFFFIYFSLLVNICPYLIGKFLMNLSIILSSEEELVGTSLMMRNRSVPLNSLIIQIFMQKRICLLILLEIFWLKCLKDMKLRNQIFKFI